MWVIAYIEYVDEETADVVKITGPYSSVREAENVLNGSDPASIGYIMEVEK